jgi:DNA-binding winged helix-turn-helix (wHTH) protein/TolB-like protein/TPR repeat protein
MQLQTNRFYDFGEFRLDITQRVLFRNGSPLPLTPKVFDTLAVLVEHAGRILEKDELMKKVWRDSFVEEANLAVNISSIRKALGESAGGAQFIETIPRRGYRFVAEVTEVSEPPLTAAASNSAAGALNKPFASSGTRLQSSSESANASRVTNPYADGVSSAAEGSANASVVLPKWAITAAVLLILAGVFTIWLVRQDSQPRSATQPRSLAVLPFRNQKPDPETDFLGPSLANAITTKLGYVSAVSATIVRPASYVGRYSNQVVDPKRFAQELDVDALLTGSYIKDGDDLRISAELIDVHKDVSLWSAEINLKYDRLLTVQDQVSQQVISGLRVTLSPDETELFNRDRPTNADAYEHFLHGVDLYQTNRFATAIQELEKALELSPKWALAWAHLGRARSANAAFHLSGRVDYDKAIECYNRALELNPQQNEARIFMANFLTDTGRVQEAVPLLREVLKTNSNLAEAHWELGYAYRFGGMVEQSIAECELARKLNPAVKLYSSALNAYLYNGDYDKFIHSLPPTDIAYIVFYRGLASYYKKEPEAASYFDRAFELDRSFYTRIGKALTHAIRGQRQEGIDLLLDTRQMIEERDVGDAEGIYKVAQAYAALGDKPSALHVLRHSIEAGFFCYPYFVSDPLLASLHDEAEWAELMSTARTRHEEFKRSFF